MAFVNDGSVTATYYTGDGGGSRALGCAADFALVVPVVSDGSAASVVVSANGASGVSGEAAAGFSAGSDLTVPASHNVSGIEYRVLAFRDSAAAVAEMSVPIPAACGYADGTAPARLADSFALSGACSYEFWGKPKSVIGSKYFIPLLMGGNGADRGSNGYSLGLYGYAADPDNHGWSGAAIRVMNSGFLARERVSPYASINRYNLNTGIVTAINDPVHMLATHDGSGLWRVYINGRLAKEHHRSMSLESLSDGGDGVARPLHLFTADMNGTVSSVEGEVYRARSGPVR